MARKRKQATKQPNFNAKPNGFNGNVRTDIVSGFDRLKTIPMREIVANAHRRIGSTVVIMHSVLDADRHEYKSGAKKPKAETERFDWNKHVIEPEMERNDRIINKLNKNCLLVQQSKRKKRIVRRSEVLARMH